MSVSLSHSVGLAMVSERMSLLAGCALCLFLLFVSADGLCRDGEKTYQTGESWQKYADTKCTRHTCLEDGSVSTTDSCSSDLNAPPPKFPTGNATCTADGKVFHVGDTYNVSGKCGEQMCLCEPGYCTTTGDWLPRFSCGFPHVKYGYELTLGNPDDPFPECCLGPQVPMMKIVPDVLDSLPDDLKILHTVYSGFNTSHWGPGSQYTPTQVKDAPRLEFKEALPEDRYLLVMVDPDAPNPQPQRQFLHWLIANIPGGNFTQGEVVADYIGSGPPKGTGFHRYFFLLFKQPGPLSFPENTYTTVLSRRGFTVRALVDQHHLGQPVALNAYKAEWDEYVPILHKKLGIKRD